MPLEIARLQRRELTTLALAVALAVGCGIGLALLFAD
jgi:hypothetical protein